MKLNKQQQGMFSLGFSYLVLSLGFFVVMAFKIVPPYFDNIYIKEALTDLSSGGEDVRDLSNRELRTKLSNFFTVNNIRGDVTKQIKIERKSNKVMVMIDYQKRIHLFGNAEVVISFENHWDSSNPSVCCKPVTSEES